VILGGRCCRIGRFLDRMVVGVVAYVHVCSETGSDMFADPCQNDVF